MHYIVNPSRLKNLLRLDALLGGTTAVVGLAFSSALAKLLGLSTLVVIIVAGITLLYAGLAGWLAVLALTSVRLTRWLIQANWLWTFISLGLWLAHLHTATGLGVVFLLLLVIVVVGLAYLEGKQLSREP